MIETIERHAEGFEVMYHNQQSEVIQSDTVFLNAVLTKQLTTLEGRLNALKKILDLQRNIPIVINHETIFTLTSNRKDVNRMYINIQAIDTMHKAPSSVAITFKSGRVVQVDARAVYSRIQTAKKSLKKLSVLWDIHGAMRPW